MKLKFKTISIVVAAGFVFYDYSISLGILLTTFALEVIRLSHISMEQRVMKAETLSAKLVYPHFLLVLIVMIGSLAVSFLFPTVFSPYGVAVTFILERIYFFVSKAFIKEG